MLKQKRVTLVDLVFEEESAIKIGDKV